MTIRNLQIFVEVANCGLMSKAAKKLFVSQSSISQAISEIEKTYNVRLFDRIGKKLFLTSTGSELLLYARQLLAQNSFLEDWLRQSGGKKNLRVGATISVGSSVIAPILGKLRKMMPDVHQEIFIENTHLVEQQILQNELDIGLVEGKIQNPDLAIEPVMDDNMVFVCGRGHPLFGRKEIEVGEMQNLRFVLREEGSGTRKQVVDVLENANITFDIIGVSYSIESIKNIVMYDGGVSILPERLVQNEVKVGMLSAAAIKDVCIKRTFDIVYHKRKFLSEAMSLFIELCKSYE